MTSLALFSASCLALYFWRAACLLVPVLFFVIGGVFGNAVIHTWWSIVSQDYFPGFVTALLFWVVGPMLLANFIPERKPACTLMAITALALVGSTTVFMNVPPA